MSDSDRKRQAVDVQENDTLLDLDNGFVVEVGPAEDNMSWRSGFQSSAVDSDLVLITFHDSQGEENHLVVRSDFLLLVRREA